MATTALAKAGIEDLAQTQQYQRLLIRCQEIKESARTTSLDHYWRLGEAISTVAPRDERAQWGSRLIVRLEGDLSIDRTTLIRSVQLYEQFTKQALVTGGHRTWGNLRLLLPLPDEMRRQILALIDSGDLLTQDDVRVAVLDAKRDAGMLPPSVLGDAEPNLLGVKGVHADKLRALWRRAEPLSRCLLLRSLIPELELEKAPRPEALAAIHATRERLDQYEEQLSAGEGERC